MARSATWEEARQYPAEFRAHLTAEADANATTMPLIYFDHNYVVTAQQGPEPYHAHLRQLATTGRATFALSPMHWVEANCRKWEIGRAHASTPVTLESRIPPPPSKKKNPTCTHT